MPPDLNRVYADVTEKYPYQSLQHLPDGVRMANQDNDCLVQLGRIQINENVMYYQASKEKCMDIFGLVCGKLNIQQFMTFGIKLTASLPMSTPDASIEFLERCAFKMGEADWNLLGPGMRGPGFRVVLHQDGVIDLRIEPFYGDTSELYVELDIQHPEPFNSLGNVGQWMDQTYDYMFGSVKQFIGAIADKS